jgi:twitching motility protein PilT
MARIQPFPAGQSSTPATTKELTEPLIDLLRQCAQDDSISDIHLAEDSSVLWVRRHGQLESFRKGLKASQVAECIDTLLNHDGELAQRKSRLAKFGDVDLGLQLGSARLRANIYQASGNRSAAMRTIRASAPDLSKLGVPGPWWDLLGRSAGLLLVTGATGSGKSTTLASSLTQIGVQRRAHIITLEDPIEYRLSSPVSLIEQRQLGVDFHDYRQGLRAALRQDPDVILVGELRDRDTVQTAIDAANTGHLVMGTLHTNNAQLAVDRLISFFPGEDRDWVRTALSRVLVGVLSQFLIRSTDGGRKLVAELMIGTNAIRQAIKDGKPNQLFSIMDTGQKEGHQLLNRALADFVRRGLVEANEATYTSYDPQGLKRELGNG